LSKVSVIIPALNEEEAIERVVRAVPHEQLNGMGYDVEVLVVDNGSEDRTGELAREAGAEVVFEPARGYGRAYKTGFGSAQGDIIATADADLTYPMEDIPKLLRLLLDDNLDFVTTDRFADMDGDAMTLRNKIGNGILNVTTRLLFRLSLRDSQSGMWLFRKEVLESLVLKSDGMPFSEELKIEAFHFARCRWKEVPIRYGARQGSVKLRAWQDGFYNFLYLLRKRVIR
jgi:glycosyltransferase involved in cell wall biosynthesis